MGISAEAVTTDKLGRRSGPRRKYTIAEKRSMVEETQIRGASVPEVALRHGVNANLLSVWRRLYRQGTLVDEVPRASAALLPVKVTTPTMMPAVAVVAITGRMLNPPSCNACPSFRGTRAVSFRTKLRANARTVAQNTARNADIPNAMKTAMATSDVK